MEDILGNPITLVIGFALISFLPMAFSVGTAFLKIVVVFNLLKNAIGIQQIPPMMVINGLALVIAVYVLMPVIVEVLALVEARGGAYDAEFMLYMINEGSEPYRRFLINNTNDNMLTLFKTMAMELWPESMHDSVNNENFIILLPAFTLTELQEAFEIGFIIYVPFLVVDIVVSNILLAMGMMMMSPMTISLPFKLLLFVFVDGWTLLLNNLVLTYVPP